MTQEDLEQIKEVVRDEIKKTVNGKIDNLSQQLEPVLAGLKWAQTTVRFLKWTGIPIIAVAAWLWNRP